MNPRQAVIIAMLLSATVYLLANISPSGLNKKVGSIKQVSDGGS